jgi:hypothetical protein
VRRKVRGGSDDKIIHLTLHYVLSLSFRSPALGIALTGVAGLEFGLNGYPFHKVSRLSMYHAFVSSPSMLHTSIPFILIGAILVSDS